jgi:hypothetical protein
VALVAGLPAAGLLAGPVFASHEYLNSANAIARMDDAPDGTDASPDGGDGGAEGWRGQTNDGPGPVDGWGHGAHGWVANEDDPTAPADGEADRPDGTVGPPDGAAGRPDGTVGRPDGTVGPPDGTVGPPDGAAGRPDGTVGRPDGEVDPSRIGERAGDGDPEQGGPSRGEGRPGGDASSPGPDGSADRGTAVACDPNALIAAITLANGAGSGTLELARNCHYVLTVSQDGNGLPVITGRLKIDGNNATIERAAAVLADFRLLTVAAGGELIAKDLNLVGGRDSTVDGGGALLVQLGAFATIVDSTFRTNLTTGASGGAIANYGVLELKHSVLSDNTAPGGSGGAIVSVGVLRITGSELTRNIAFGGGGAVFSEDSLFELTESKVTENQAVTGGGIASTGLIKVSRSVIADNVASLDGGGLYLIGAVPATIRETIVSGNTATNNGGGVFNLATTTIEDSKIVHNAAGFQGGGIYNQANLILRNVEVQANRAVGLAGAGAGIWSTFNSTTALLGTEVSGNVATTPPGGAGFEGTTFTLDAASVIVGNSPTNCLGSPITITGCFG